jgi:hypothetical protein
MVEVVASVVVVSDAVDGAVTAVVVDGCAMVATIKSMK